jgi:hypothetical protein
MTLDERARCAPERRPSGLVARQIHGAREKPAPSSAVTTSSPVAASTHARTDGDTTTGRPHAMASNTLFWMPRATRSGTTHAVAARR